MERARDFSFSSERPEGFIVIALERQDEVVEWKGSHPVFPNFPLSGFTPIENFHDERSVSAWLLFSAKGTCDDADINFLVQCFLPWAVNSYGTSGSVREGGYLSRPTFDKLFSFHKQSLSVEVYCCFNFF